MVFRKIGVLSFLETLVLRFALLPYYCRINVIFIIAYVTFDNFAKLFDFKNYLTFILARLLQSIGLEFNYFFPLELHYGFFS